MPKNMLLILKLVSRVSQKAQDQVINASQHVTTA